MIWGSDKKIGFQLLIPPFVTAHFHVRTPLMGQWKESFAIVNRGKEGGTDLYFSCSYDWLFLSPFFPRVKKLLWFKGFLFTQDMILRSPQALCIYALFEESLSKSHFMVMAYDCVNGKLWNRSLWLFPMNTWISYGAKQGERSPLLNFFHMTFFLIFKKLQSKNICRNHPQLKLTSWEPGSKFSTHSENRLEFQ